MTLKVIGVGFGRTGTKSLKVALEDLGFDKCYHLGELVQHPEHVTYWEKADRGESVDWDTLFVGYQATTDYPGLEYWRELVTYYPESKVILTVRDPDAWYESFREEVMGFGLSWTEKLWLALRYPFSANARYFSRVMRMMQVDLDEEFEGRFEDKAYSLAYFHRHIAEVKAFVPAERLLVYQVTEATQDLLLLFSPHIKGF